MDAKQRIARRVARELRDGDVVNLGIGLPTMVANYLPADIHITLQSENGFLGLGPVTTAHPDLVNAGGQPCGILPGAAMFDSAMSFALIRGGHVDACVLGGLQVDEQANLANWVVPGKMVPGMGGAMDLVTGARKVIIAMEHCAKDGAAKILRHCTMPLTAQHAVHMLVTELAVFRFIDGKMWLTEIAEGCDITALREKTDAQFAVATDWSSCEVTYDWPYVTLYDAFRQPLAARSADLRHAADADNVRHCAVVDAANTDQHGQVLGRRLLESAGIWYADGADHRHRPRAGQLRSG